MHHADRAEQTVSFTPMPDHYIPRFTGTLISHYSGCLQRAMGYPERVAREITIQQVGSLRNAQGMQKINHMTAARLDGRVIGGAWYSAPAKQVAHLHWVMIEEEYRGCGYGKKLVQHVIDHCRSTGSEGVVLQVFSENNEAAEFYSRRGFSTMSNEMYIKL